MELLNRAIVTSLPFVPRALLGFFARPYVAGEELDQALATIEALGREGCRTTIDVLGEEINAPESARDTLEQYFEALNTIAGRGLDSNLSVKLSALGLRISPTLCEENLRALSRRALDRGSFVRIDMEDATTTDATLALYERLRGDFENLGVVMQARLHRTLDDVRRLLPLKPSVRVVKGIYLERPELAHQSPQRIREAYMEVVEALLDGGCRVALATHDPQLVERSLALIERRGLGQEEYEFQMLLGVAQRLRRDLVNAGHQMRVYVPFGRDWYAYTIRRLKENPDIARQVLRNMITLGRL